jgi:hypothetical protein
MRRLILSEPGIDREQLRRRVLQHYGLVRMTNHVVTELDRIYSRPRPKEDH